MKGNPFGPFRQFRIDTCTLPDGQFQATGFDAGQPGTEVAMPFVIVLGKTRESAWQECDAQIKSSPEWAAACKLEVA